MTNILTSVYDSVCIIINQDAFLLNREEIYIIGTTHILTLYGENLKIELNMCSMKYYIMIYNISYYMIKEFWKYIQHSLNRIAWHCFTKIRIQASKPHTIYDTMVKTNSPTQPLKYTHTWTVCVCVLQGLGRAISMYTHALHTPNTGSCPHII